MKTFKEWLLVEKKVEIETCSKKVVEIPKGKNEKKYLAKLFAKGSHKEWTQLEVLDPGRQRDAARLGYEELDSISAGGFNVFLLYGPRYPEGLQYHIGFERQGFDVFSINQQFNRPTGEKKDMGSQAQAIEPIINKIEEWVIKYGEIVIASTNPKLTQKWKNVLTYTAGDKFRVDNQTYHGHQLYILRK